MSEKAFRESLPRLYELKDLVAASNSRDAYFQRFEQMLGESRNVYEKYLELERVLGTLDPAAWSDLKGRAEKDLVSKVRAQGRGWQPLFDLFNEARAFAYLVSVGVQMIKFVPTRRDKRTPDLSGILHGQLLYCEVKTINPSEVEAGRRAELAIKGFAPAVVEEMLTPEFLEKLRKHLCNAVQQIDAVDPNRVARRIVFVVVNFDDRMGNLLSAYFSQIDRYLSQDPVSHAEIVFFPASNPFKTTITMKSATVLAG